jgi:hypothetical protein
VLRFNDRQIIGQGAAVIDEKKLEERLVALEAAKSWSPRVVSRLETLLRSGADEALYRINPIQFATEKSISEAEAIDLFLAFLRSRAVRHGLAAHLSDVLRRG